CGTCDRETDELYRCTNCPSSEYQCNECMMEEHEELPTHRPEMWTPSGWCTTTFAQLGLVYCLGHECKPCPLATNPPFSVIAIDTSGIQLMKISICECRPQTALHSQFIRNRWIPSSPLNPKAIISIRCLEQYRSMEEQGMSPTSYYESL
ncbi:hypothetical protein SCHPADRAFT_803358, partial [Schizopora paradoxa]